MRLKRLKLALLSGVLALWLISQPLSPTAAALKGHFAASDATPTRITAFQLAPQMTPSPLLAQTPEAEFLFHQGIEQYQANRFPEAIAAWQSALEQYQQAHNIERVGLVSNAIAAAYLQLSQYAAAITWAEQALAIAEAQNNRVAQAQALGNLGIAYRDQGRYWQAIETYQRSLEQVQTGTAAEAQLLGLLSNAYSALGDYERAIPLQTRSLNLARSLGNEALAAVALRNLGALNTTVGNYAAALEHYQASLHLAELARDRPGIAYTLQNLGVVYHSLDNIPQAITYYQQSLALARAVSQSQLEAAALSNLGIAYEDLDDYAQAIAMHRESLAIAQASTDPQAIATSLNNLGHALLGANRLDEAQATLQQAIEILADLRQNLSDLYTLSVFDTQVHTYNLLQQVLVAQADYSQALEVAEQGRTRALINLVASQQANAPLPASPAIADMQALAQQLHSTLVEYSTVPNDAFKFQVQGKRRGQTARLFIWVIQPTGAVYFRQLAVDTLEQPLESLIAQSRSHSGRGLRRSIRVEPDTAAETPQGLQALYQVLITPIQDLLPSDPKAQVIFIPHETLFWVPFAALQTPDQTYLIDHHTLSIAPSIQLLGLTHSASPAPALSARDRALVVGNPTMPSLALSPGEPPQPLPPLPGAEQEALTIAQLFQTRLFRGAAATETAIAAQMPHARLIHLATHGLLDLDLPSSGELAQLHIPGAIALAPTAEADGWLTATEIASLDLSADLVVLSACDTGLGEITGDGILGLSRSLLGAGAKSTVVSLWAVPDTPTAELMTTFYQALLTGQGKAQALRQALLKTKAHYPNPSDWAAFILIGHPN
ncbi:CHAT domain-containing protein [Almyronema epifaneia]|uniref:CHAT domain-containing protein n=1 Tax=Almyronema epifaneia S1 TaxID=2991925 RepID=A0ABW6I9V2_9CYAN